MMDLDNLKEKLKQKYVYKLKDDVTLDEIKALIVFDDTECMLYGQNYFTKDLGPSISFALNCGTREVTIFLEDESFDYLIDPTILPEIVTLIESGYFHKVPLPLAEDVEKDYKTVIKTLEELKTTYEKRKCKEVSKNAR